ncbi:MAG: reverse transcriptase domain-containing protein [Patescibacteria group bacterium]
MIISNTLQANDDSLKLNFINLRTRRNLASLLEIEYGHLNYLLYYSKKQKYKQFEINKRSGGKRTISAPIFSIKIIQKKLSHILGLIFEPKIVVHGFVAGRSILSNAEKHVKRNLILNIDLKNFFDSINFGRIRGLFLAAPYNFSDEVATTIAQIACYDNKLPQGSPLSPILSNMITSGLDYKLQKLAKQYNCLYTRYADDITFSTNKEYFDKNIVLKNKNDNHSWFLGKKIVEIINKNGFEINDKKVKVQHKTKRQEVTGVIVNEFKNVRRSLVREVRGMLHAWEIYGIKDA